MFLHRSCSISHSILRTLSLQSLTGVQCTLIRTQYQSDKSTPSQTNLASSSKRPSWQHSKMIDPTLNRISKNGVWNTCYHSHVHCLIKRGNQQRESLRGVSFLPLPSIEVKRVGLLRFISRLLSTILSGIRDKN